MDPVASGPFGADAIRDLRRIGERFGVSNIRLFGSRARGGARPESDVDLLVSIDYRPGVARRLVRFRAEAAALLGADVDVITDGALDPVLHARILREARPL